MIELLPILHEYCTLQIYLKVGGCNKWPHTVVWEVWGNTLVGEVDFYRFKQYRWHRRQDPYTNSYYVYRFEYDANGKREEVNLAREVLDLKRSPGKGATEQPDHKNHDTLDNSPENLREANASQNGANTKRGNSLGFSGVTCNGDGYLARIVFYRLTICFPTVKKKIEAGLMHWYADVILNGEFAYQEVFPPEEMPTFERQQKLLQMVVTKLNEKGYPVGEWGLAA
jgi:hypothetical protein